MMQRTSDNLRTTGAAKVSAPLVHRRGFTLTELLVVTGIVLALAVFTVPVALRMNEGRQLRDTSREMQALFAGARQRAMSSRQAVGVRLIPDVNDPSIVRSLQYIEESPPITQGGAIVVPTDPANPNTPNVSSGWPNVLAPAAPLIFSRVVLVGVDQDVPQILKQRLPRRAVVGGVNTYYGTIRLEHAGKLLAFKATEAELDFTYGPRPFPMLTLIDAVTELASPQTLSVPFGTSADFTGTVDPTDTWHPDNWRTDPADITLLDPSTVAVDYSISLLPRPIAGEEQVALPGGMVIDLGYIPPPSSTAVIDSPQQRLSQLRPSRVEYDSNTNRWNINWDIMISPSGRVVGTAATETHVILWLRELAAGVSVENVGTAGELGTFTGSRKLVRQTGTGSHSLIAIYTKNGRVQSATPRFVTSTAPAIVSNPPNGQYFDPRRYYDPILTGSSGGL